MSEEIANKDTLKLLVEGKLEWNEVKKLLRLSPKDRDRFWKYLDILQERVSWKDRILLRISDHLYIVEKAGGGRVVKCDCGHEFGDYRSNWKLSCRVHVRRTAEDIAEVVSVVEALPDPDLVEIREFYCPGCYSQLGVEVVPPGHPVLFEMLPDLDTLYRDWLGKPLGDGKADWYMDKTWEVTERWAEGG